MSDVVVEALQEVLEENPDMDLEERVALVEFAALMEAFLFLGPLEPPSENSL